MNVLVLFTATDILGWLAGESLASAEAHVANGYPELQPDWQAGNLHAAEIEVPAGDEFSPELYQVVTGASGPEIERIQP